MPYLSIREASADMLSGLTTPTELVGEALEHIDRLDPEIQAFVTALREQAYRMLRRPSWSSAPASFAARCTAFRLASKISSQ